VERPSWAPEDVDLERPSVARVYDYYLGGSHNFAADRVFAEQVLQLVPQARTGAQENRAFLRRAVRYLCQHGVRQFIDLGSGIPTVGNVHEIAQKFDPGAKVVYVDIDPVAVAHSRAILADQPQAIVVAGDLRKPADVLANAALRQLVDFREPVAFMLVAVLHFVPDSEHPMDIVAGYAAAGVPGSYVVISHGGRITGRPMTPSEEAVVKLYERSPSPLTLRSAEEVTDLFGDLTIVEPGVVPTVLWQPDPDFAGTPPGEELTTDSAGIGRKD
jgi:hypothetical protein